MDNPTSNSSPMLKQYYSKGDQERDLAWMKAMKTQGILGKKKKKKLKKEEEK